MSKIKNVGGGIQCIGENCYKEYKPNGAEGGIRTLDLPVSQDPAVGLGYPYEPGAITS